MSAGGREGSPPACGSAALGEVDVSLQTVFASTFDQCKQVGALRLSRATSDEHDETGSRMLPRQREKVVAIASDQQQSAVVCASQHIRIRRIYRQRLAQFRHFVAFLSQNPRDIGGHVVIAKELHGCAPLLIWRAMSASISPR